MIRIAAVGDVHVDRDVLGRFRPALEELPDRADALLVAGDLTRHGTVEEARCFATEFGGLAVPVVVVLGNHDHQSDQQLRVAEVLTESDITVLDGDATVPVESTVAITLFFVRARLRRSRATRSRSRGRDPAGASR